MEEPIWGKYSTVDSTRIELMTGFGQFCEQNNLLQGSVILLKVEVRELCIALEIDDMSA